MFKYNKPIFIQAKFLSLVKKLLEFPHRVDDAANLRREPLRFNLFVNLFKTAYEDRCVIRVRSLQDTRHVQTHYSSTCTGLLTDLTASQSLKHSRICRNERKIETLPQLFTSHPLSPYYSTSYKFFLMFKRSRAPGGGGNDLRQIPYSSLRVKYRMLTNATHGPNE
jgi:hypothetical protein